MIRNKKNKLCFLVCLFLLLVNVNSALALETTYPRLPGAAPPQEFLQTAPSEQHLSLYAFYAFNLVIWLAGIIALGVLIYAGILYLLSTGKPERLSAARNQIVDAFLGILLLLSSYIVLQILNPQLTVLEIAKPEPVEIIERPEISPPPTELHLSSINTEIPWLKIIEEKVFASSSLSRIKDLSASTTAIAEELEEQSEDLKEKTDQCSCNQADPDCDDCSTYCTKGCTCDVCENVRDDIEDIEEDNLEKIDELKPLQIKIKEEIRLLREEIAKIERARKFMLECPLTSLKSLGEFLNTKGFYLTNKWLIMDVKFWEKILTIEDWGNFYCPVSGTVWGGEEYTPPEEISFVELPEEVTQEPMACLTEVPVGEVLDRAIRVSNTLALRLQTLNDLSKRLVDEVNGLHVEVSRCSSQMPMCCSFCIRIKKVCIKLCIGQACPRSDIKERLDNIKNLKSQIEEVVNGEKGIVAIIDKIIPKLLEDLGKEVRPPMKECVTEIDVDKPEEIPAILLANCKSALGAIGPDPLTKEEKGVVIENCCLEEPEFQDCLQECHLEEGQEKYKKCLQDCLKKKSEGLRKAGRITESEIIATCRHKINFYCCGK